MPGEEKSSQRTRGTCRTEHIDMVGVDMAGACKKTSISCENIKQGGVSYVARHSQHAIEEKIAPDISKVLDISNRTAYMSQQHNGMSMGRYDYQGSGGRGSRQYFCGQCYNCKGRW